MDAYFARQPIFDRSGDPVAYELLYRASADAVSASGDTAMMSAQVLCDALLGMDLALVTDGHPAFLNAGREALVGGPLETLDPSRVVIEVLETVAPDAEVMEACERLTEAGHTLALDDFSENDPRIALARYASILKVDVLDRPMPKVIDLVRPFRENGRRLRLLAERVETKPIHEQCVEAGFELFQGYFYRRPEIVREKDLRPSQLQLIQTMNLVQDDSVSDSRLGEHLKADPTLAYKVVRMANVAALGSRQIESVRHAASIVGRGALFRWLSLMLSASYGGNTGFSRELLREALVRARMCELMAETIGLRPHGHLFLVGLFSRLEPLLGVPLPTIVGRIALPEAALDALLRGAGPYAPLLELVDTWEAAQWDDVTAAANAAGMPGEALLRTYTAALEWALDVSKHI